MEGGGGLAYLYWWPGGDLAVSEEVLAGTEIPGCEGIRRLHLSLHCHHQNDSCIKMGSGVGYFKVSLRGTKSISHEDSVHKPQRQCP